MSLEKALVGNSNYDNSEDIKIIQNVKLFYQESDPEVKAILQNRINDLNNQKSWKSIKRFIGKFIVYILIFIVFVVNFIAVSLSLGCNRISGNIFQKIYSATFAFIFGIIYIIVNYGHYRFSDNEFCEMCKQNPFPF